MKILFTLVTIAILSASAYLYISQSPVESKIRGVKSIMILGDSIISGYKVNPEDSLPSKTEKYLKEAGHNVTIINAGISGDTTSGGLGRIQGLINEHKPEALVIALGGNDILRMIKPNEVKANLELIIKAANENNIPVILNMVEAPINLGMGYKGKFKSAYQDLAKKHALMTYPFFLKDIFGNRKLMQADGIHPNSAGLDLIAQEFSQYLAKNL